jgi:broad specificity phosphatase PhoE
MRPKVWRALDELYAGVFDGRTYEEIEREAPEEFAARKADKLGYRYPRGESYLDVIRRLDVVVHEIERLRDPVLLIGHQGIIRVLYAYFMGMDRAKCPFLSIPLNHVIKLTPGAYKCQEERICLLRSKKDAEPNSC